MYYYHDGANEVGPYSLDNLLRLRDSGLITSGTLIRHGDGASWTPLGEVVDREHHDPGAGGGAGLFASSWSSTLQASAADGAARAPAAQAAPAPLPTLDVPQVEGPAPTRMPPAPAATTDAHSGWPTQPPAPWRRLAARLLDTTFNGFLGFALLGLTFYSIAPATADATFGIFAGEIGGILDLILTSAMASLIGGLLIGATGFTLGKVIFGVVVTRPDGRPLGLRAGVARDFSVFVKGLGLAIPIVTWLSMWLAYRRLQSRGVTSWDEGHYLVRHRPSGSAQYLLNAVGILMIILLFVVISSLDGI